MLPDWEGPLGTAVTPSALDPGLRVQQGRGAQGAGARLWERSPGAAPGRPAKPADPGRMPFPTGLLPWPFQLHCCHDWHLLSGHLVKSPSS